MRSASRLDFFAKSLALAGLGVLGLSAVLIDRWSTELPAVPRPGIDATAPAVQVGLALHESALPALAPPTERRRVSEARSPASKPDAAAAAIAPAPNNEPVDSPPPQLPAPVELRPVRGAVVALSGPPPAVDTRQPMAASTVAEAERSDEGFFSGALKKTSSSVSNSLGKASNSVVGAVRVLGDAVKRVF